MRKVVMKRFVKGAVITVMAPVCISSRGRWGWGVRGAGDFGGRGEMARKIAL